MKDLMSLVAECEKELDAIEIPYRTVRNWTVNTRAQCRWGQCKRVADGVYDINISARLLQDDAPDDGAKETIIHELLHTVKGCVSHKEKWKSLADKVNRSYPQYHIKRTNFCEEKGVEEQKRTRRVYEKKYMVVCARCRATIYRKKASKVVCHPEKFRCGLCKGKFEVVEI